MTLINKRKPVTVEVLAADWASSANLKGMGGYFCRACVGNPPYESQLRNNKAQIYLRAYRLSSRDGRPSIKKFCRQHGNSGVSYLWALGNSNGHCGAILFRSRSFGLFAHRRNGLARMS